MLTTRKVIIYTVYYLMAAMFLSALLTIHLNYGRPKYKDFSSYSDFKKKTEVVEGTVIKAQEIAPFIIKSHYLIISNKKYVMRIKVNEKEFNKYQKSSKVKFRINEDENNKAIIDLNEQNDVTNFQEFKKKYTNDGFF